MSHGGEHGERSPGWFWTLAQQDGRELGSREQGVIKASQRTSIILERLMPFKAAPAKEVGKVLSI